MTDFSQPRKINAEKFVTRVVEIFPNDHLPGLGNPADKADAQWNPLLGIVIA